ncbi:MAG: hypothetical protein M0C28_29660 [Candidatus Moduliflexus flocculans]|nr:hypothetical protein [Candidatus Moduliflexus flocculans]
MKFVSLQFTRRDRHGQERGHARQRRWRRAGGRRLVRRLVGGRLRPHPGKRHAPGARPRHLCASCPWTALERRRARLFCDIYTPDGKPFEGDPRGVLKRMLAKLAGARLDVQHRSRAGVLPVQGANGGDGVHPVPHDVGGYFDFSADDEAVRVRTELMDALNSDGSRSRSRTPRGGARPARDRLPLCGRARARPTMC